MCVVCVSALLQREVGLILTLSECAMLSNFSLEWTVCNIQSSQGSSNSYSPLFDDSFKRFDKYVYHMTVRSMPAYFPSFLLEVVSCLKLKVYSA